MNRTITNENGELQVLAPAAAGRYRSLTDEQLLNRVAAGDESAGAFLVFHRHGDSLTKLAAQHAERGCTDALLSELVSEVYTHFAQHGWARLLPTTIGNVGGYLYVVERNLLRMLARSNFRHMQGELDTAAASDGGAAGMEGYEAADQMERAMARLSATRRFVLGKRMMEGYGSKEVADMLPDFWRSIGMCQKTAPTHAYVDNLVCAARKELRAFFV